MNMSPSSWERIGEALRFYTANGFKYIDLPWIAPREYQKLTTKQHPDLLVSNDVYTDNALLVGSGEQAFLSLELDSGNYVGVTPCFRSGDVHEPGNLHKPYFMKVELFHRGHNNARHILSGQSKLIAWAMQFMRQYADLVYDPTAKDIMLNGIEVGSYCVRDTWACCTGLAEPRFSHALGEPTGYHNTHIPRADYGTLQKVQEELREAQDAKRSGNAVMLLHELSDMIGAVDGYLREHHPTITIDDLVQQSEATRRAFESGNRE